MAEGDNRARQNGTVAAPGGLDRELGPAVVKASPIAMPRLPEDGAATSGRSVVYATAVTGKDVLPEHTARRNAHIHITTSTA
jgi:hypothetical protein